MDREAAVILTQQKNLAIGIVLSLLFGGLGLFYASILGGIVMSLVQVVAWVTVFITFGFGVVLLPVVHFFCMIWAAVSINAHNKRLIERTFD